jgi:hypothetical protein
LDNNKSEKSNKSMTEKKGVTGDRSTKIKSDNKDDNDNNLARKGLG